MLLRNMQDPAHVLRVSRTQKRVVAAPGRDKLRRDSLALVAQGSRYDDARIVLRKDAVVLQQLYEALEFGKRFMLGIVAGAGDLEGIIYRCFGVETEIHGADHQ